MAIGKSRDEPLTRDVEWRAEVKRVREGYIPLRVEIVLHQLWKQGLVPEVAAASVRRDADQVTLEAPRGAIHYTLDGSDPRQVGGAVSATAQVYEKTFKLGDGGTIKARMLHEGEWSALIEIEGEG